MGGAGTSTIRTIGLKHGEANLHPGVKDGSDLVFPCVRIGRGGRGLGGGNESTIRTHRCTNPIMVCSI